jgi:hypothetical protein
MPANTGADFSTSVVRQARANPMTGDDLFEIVCYGPCGDYTWALHTDQSTAQAEADRLEAMLLHIGTVGTSSGPRA